MNLPKQITLTGYGKSISFTLTSRREIKYYGRTKDSNESLWRAEKLNDNEVFYESEWGWGVFVNTDTMETMYNGTEWSGQKIIF